MPTPDPAEGHHPGPPRFVHVDEQIVDPIFVDASHGMDRDNLAPRIKGTLEKDPSNYSASDFSWSVASKPADSSAAIRYAAEPWENSGGSDPYEVESGEDGIARYEPGTQNVAEFIPDVPGTYVLQLDAPDGTHEQTIRVFPQAPSDAGGPPRIDLEASYDSTNSEFVVESNPNLAPNSNQSESDLTVVFLADDRDALSTGDIVVEGTTARIPASAVGEGTARLHAAAYDGEVHSVTDTITLDGANAAIDYPNRPPQWIEDGVMYEIFTRSFEGTPGGTTFNFMQQKVSYLSDLGVDVVWLTPVVPSESSNWKPNNGYEYVGGGPHGYDALSYYHIAPDLGTDGTRETAMQEYKAFIDECHNQGIKVCFDFVINHGGRHHPLFQDTIGSKSDTEPSGWTYDAVDSWNTDSKYFDWFDRRDGPITDSSGNVVDVAPASTGFWGLRVMPQWDYSSLAWREHILAAAAFWAEVGVDAFRCDIAWGVPHSIWKEVREVVRSYDSEFMLLDEAIPNDISFSENEFDLHFDTADFMNTAHAAAKGDVNGQALYDAVKKREKEGWPDFSLLVNSTENHDEQRCLKLAKQGSRSNPEKAQRAAWAAGVALPGVPFVYYGQERQITNYGENRHQGSSDPRDGDIGPNKYKRAFMNWDSYPQDHLQFYRDMLALYQQTDVLKPDADLTTAWFQSDDDVLVFGRDASGTDRDTISGPEKAVVIVNFQDAPATVDLRPSVSSKDLFTGTNVDTTTGETMTVEVDEVAVLETPSLFSVGDRIASLDESAGDDNGPGSYTYPTAAPFKDGVFDMSSVTAHDGGDTYQFRVAIDGPLENPWGLPHGFSVQHLQFYLHDPTAETGSTQARAGVNATFEAPYQYRVLADGENGVRVESHDGTQVATGTVMANAVNDVIVVEVPKSVFDTGLKSMDVAPLMLGYAGSKAGQVRKVNAAQSEWNFGGGTDSGNDPNVIDMVTPEGTSQGEALAYSSDSLATLPFTPIQTPFRKTAVFEDETGDNDGPGSYTLPTADAFYDGVCDVAQMDVHESRSRVQFSFTMAEPVQNPWGLPRGFSHEFFQVYVRDPDAGTDTASTTNGRDGLTASFADPYHYRILVNGENEKQVEAADGTVVTSDVNVAVDGDTIAFDLPKDAIGGSVGDTELAPLVCAYDGYGTGHLRDVAATKGDYTFGGGSDDQIEPRVVDLITPEGTTQSDALSYSASSTATIPLVPFSQGTNLGTVASWDDETGDDHGPGSYTYPTTDQISDGVYDITQVSIDDRVDEFEFTVGTNGPITNDWGGDAGFGVHHIQVYVRDSDAGDSVPSTTDGRIGTNVTFEAPYHYRVKVEGWSNNRRVEAADGTTLVQGFPASADQEAGTISFRVPKDAIGGSLTGSEISVMMFGQDGYGAGRIRQVAASNGSWAFGGGRDDDMDSNVIDMIVPSGTTQSDALAYSADAKAQAPYVPISPGVVAVFSNSEGVVTKALLQKARDMWAAGEPVPELGGRKLTYEDVRTLRKEADL